VKWKPARNIDLKVLEPFLLAGEWKSVALSSYFCRDGAWKLPSRAAASVYICSRGEEVAGVLLRTPSGLLMPLLKDDAPGARSFPKLPRLPRGEIYSLMGTKADVLWLEEALSLIPETVVEYHLMTLRRERYTPGRAAAAPRIPGLTTRLAGVRDLGALFPLQKCYELEEVVLRPEHFRDQACYNHLRRTLKTQLTCLAEVSGSVIAKAGTNARGWNCDQVGGVYTVESLRNQGIGFALMRTLLKWIFREKSTATLFVKTANLPAAALYRRLGFEIDGGYRISYFRS
jgi:GNAT superfamily N-acetyltransferase